jgi:hypothetical protein
MSTPLVLETLWLAVCVVVKLFALGVCGLFATSVIVTVIDALLSFFERLGR